MITQRRLLAVTVLAVLVLSGCNTNKQEAIPTTTTRPPLPTTTTTTTPLPSAPAVTNPLDASTFEEDPCTSLTEEQKQQFEISGVERTGLTATEGEACFFQREESDDTLLVVFASRTSNGLTYRYLEHDHGSWTYWQPTEVDGYPAVAYGSTDTPSCIFGVGLSDSLHFWVLGAKTDITCTESRTVASTVLANIKATN